MTEPGQLYELRITASGEVRDAEGNLLSEPQAEGSYTVTAEQAAELDPTEGNTR